MKKDTDYQLLAEAIQQDLVLSPAPGTTSDVITDWKSAFYDEKFAIGMGLLTVSGAMFLAHDWMTQNGMGGQDAMAWFMAHYSIALLFGAVVLFNGGFAYYVRHDRRQQASVWLSLLLWWSSAFALNRQMAVFEQSVPWLNWIIVGSGLLMVLHTWADIWPRWGQQLLYAGLMGTWLFVVYQAVYVAQLYPISVPGLLALGISAHTFVPALMAWVVGRQLWVAARHRPYLRKAVETGLLVPMSLLVVFLFSWHHTADRLNRVQMSAALRQTSDLPDWVQMAQQLRPGPVTDRILKTGIVYGTSPWTRSFGDLMAFNDTRLHDPLVVIAQNLFPTPALDGATRAKLLRTVSNEQYGTEAKLWSGRNLNTTQVATQVKIWPQYRLSYTEKTIWVQSGAQWSNREALYTFHLPEGSAVSALSLWIDGYEAPARLTTQAKADSAYKTIVGVERRDPSMVTWQEGNRVTVRVFPVVAKEARQVKIGITSPLQLVGNQLIYQNAWFEGPDATKASETVKLTFDADPVALQMRGLSGELMNRALARERDYQPAWSLQFTAPPLSSHPFRLDGISYQMEVYKPAMQPFQPTDLYLDVNAAWSADEFRAICETAYNQHVAHVWVFDDGLVEVTGANRESLFASLAEKSFSLFPIDRIARPATALFITKGTANGPTLADLTGSLLANRLAQKAISLPAPVRAMNLGSDLPPYLKTLTELRVMHVVATDLAPLQNTYLAKHQFPADTKTTDEAILANTGVVIRQVKEMQQVNNQLIDRQNSLQKANLAPDHLLRLFTYNQLMQRVGRRYFDQAYRNDSTLAAVAQVGHVVSPVSSLVVLETQRDYKRFDIKKDEKGLDNATLKQDGAVPEPHEWAMLAVIALLVGWFYAKR